MAIFNSYVKLPEGIPCIFKKAIPPFSSIGSNGNLLHLGAAPGAYSTAGQLLRSPQ